ncbi:MAG: ATP-binding protein [Gemmatimonadota bacterium]|nr:ATP-binding protein [Gemmatimonadota bacterium]MDE2873548.1 ATP-binding protein [Gemmatimonadota bacterium]
MLDNLLANAARHSPETSPHPRVAAAHDGAHVAVSVADEGEGVAPDALSHLFNRHTGTDPRGRGSGLGLVICKGLVEAHGGLTAAGYAPVVTAEPGEVPRLVETRRPRLVLLDLVLPGTVFRAVSSDASVATVSASRSTITTRGVANGAATVTVTATDPEGLAVSQDFEIMVPNRSPVVSDSISDQELFRGDSLSGLYGGPWVWYGSKQVSWPGWPGRPGSSEQPAIEYVAYEFTPVESLSTLNGKIS